MEAKTKQQSNSNFHTNTKEEGQSEAQGFMGRGNNLGGCLALLG